MRLTLLFVVLVFSCSEPQKKVSLDIQGHRGARGLMPENTIEGFLKAIDLGVTTLEMDLAVSRDNQLVLSHEPYFSPEFCADSLGQRITESTKSNIYELSQSEIEKCDCGSLKHERFPNQKKFKVSKPTLDDVIDSVESYTTQQGIASVNYNIEIKTRAELDNIYHPEPSVFSDLLYDKLKEKNVLNRSTIQSFDFRPLQYIQKKYPGVTLALLIENELGWQKNVDSLGFKPDIYSCYFKLLTEDTIAEIKKSGISVIPWTVNDTKDMQQLIDWGVDGIITDYPDRIQELISK